MRREWDKSGNKMFDGENSVYVLWRILSEMVADPALSTVCLLVDALDECDIQSTAAFLTLLTRHKWKDWQKVKWIISSRNELRIREWLQEPGAAFSTSLELNSRHVTGAVEAFIRFKVDQLADRKRYQITLKQSMMEYLAKHADGTFLWVALVCKELEKVAARKAQKVMESFPAGLTPLYDRMMELVRQDEDDDEVELRLILLRTATLAYRPLDLDEIGFVAGYEEGLRDNEKDLIDLVTSCGSFLTVSGQKVTFVHQSAKDYLTASGGCSIFPSGSRELHTELTRRQLDNMSAHLKRDVCGLRLPDASAQDVDANELRHHLPGHVQYACCYWGQHVDGCREVMGDDGPVHIFLQKHLLHWLEALGVLGRVSDAVHTCTTLQGMVKVRRGSLSG